MAIIYEVYLNYRSYLGVIFHKVFAYFWSRSSSSLKSIQFSQGQINQNHPHSGWFAQGLKAPVSSQRLKALAFSSFKPLCVRFSRCP